MKKSIKPVARLQTDSVLGPKEILLYTGITTLGRSELCTVRIELPEIAPIHARFDIEFGEHFISSPAQDLIKFGEKSLRAGREYQLLTGRKITLGPLVYRYEILEQLGEEKHLITIPDEQSTTIKNSFNFLQPSDNENSEEDSVKSPYLTRRDTIPNGIEVDDTIATIPINDLNFLKQGKIESTASLNDDTSDTTIDYEEEPHQTAPTQPMNRQEPVETSQDECTEIPCESEVDSFEGLIRSTRSRGKKPPLRVQDSGDENESDATSESFPSLDKILGELESNRVTTDTIQESDINTPLEKDILPKNNKNNQILPEESEINNRKVRNDSTEIPKARSRRNPTRTKRSYVEEDLFTDESDPGLSTIPKHIRKSSQTTLSKTTENPKLHPKVAPVYENTNMKNDMTKAENEIESSPSVTSENKHGKRGNEENEEKAPKKQKGTGNTRVQIDLSEQPEIVGSSNTEIVTTPSPNKLTSKRPTRGKPTSKKGTSKAKSAAASVKKNARTKSPDMKKQPESIEQSTSTDPLSLNTSASNLESSFEDDNGSRKYPGRSKRKSMYAGLGSLSPCSIKKPKVVFTGFTDTSKAKFVEQLGGTMEESWQTATHIVAMSIKRTSKFLCGLCSGKPIVSPEWVDRSMVEKHFIDETGFELLDANAEKQYDFRLSESLMRARQVPLMKGLKIFTTKKVNSGIREIAEVAGAELLSVLPPSPSTTKPPNVIVIGTEQDAKECAQILKEGFPVYLTEFVSIGALRQELDFDNHQFVISKRRTSGRRRS